LASEDISKRRKRKDFKSWYSEQAKKWDLDPNPDNPLHFYNYRAAYKAGVEPGPDGHWPSEFKKTGHPNRFVDDVDTKTNRPISPIALYRNKKRYERVVARAKKKESE